MPAKRTNSDGVVDRTLGALDGPPSRYDLVLAVIPLVLVLGMVAGRVGDVPLHDALLAASLVATAAVADALFVNPPRQST